ncbi:MAG: outer membrane beta-barrel protein [Saprospiraceae bacterium]|nr:outer membrane beta-barrel protein [Saprospiraceae bacterium]
MNARAIFTAIFLFTVLGAAVAQSRYQMGFTIGSNYSSLRSDLFTTSSGRLGVAAGCTFSLGFGDRFELNPEIIFTQKGASAKAVYFRPEEPADQRTYDFYYNTFEAGLFAGYQPSATVPVRIQAGGFFGTHFHTLNKNNRDVMLGDYENINNATPAYQLNDAFSGVDFGPAIGISAGEGRFRANARYYFGAANLYNNLDFVEGGHRIRTNSLRLTLTYFLK